MNEFEAAKLYNISELRKFIQRVFFIHIKTLGVFGVDILVIIHYFRKVFFIVASRVEDSFDAADSFFVVDET